MIKKTLRIMTSQKCNYNCEYCQLDKNIENTVKDIEVINFIKNNLDYIDKTKINLLGGEPTICYSEELYEFLFNNFNSVIFVSNMKDKQKIEYLINKFKNKIKFMVSINEFTEEDIKWLTKYKKYINRFSYIVTKNRENKIYEDIKWIKNINIPIKLSPEHNENEYLFNKDVLINQFIKINNSFGYLVENFLYDIPFKNQDCDDCLDKLIIITPNGDICNCSYSNSNYKRSNHIPIGNIYNNNLNNLNYDIIKQYKNKEVIGNNNIKCKNCRKCNNYFCYTRGCSSSENKILSQICQFNDIIYDFLLENKKYYIDINEISLFMTEKCNLKCTYCFEQNYKNRLGNIPNEYIEKAMYLLNRYDTGINKRIVFFGGEPTLNIEGIEYSFKVAKKLKDNGLKNKINFIFNTNLYFLNPKLIQIIKEYSKYFFIEISISLDGCKEANDICRIDIDNNGTYDKIISNVHALYQEFDKCKNVRIIKHSVLSNENIKYIDKILDTAYKEKFLFDELSLSFTTPAKGITNPISRENIKMLSYKSLELFNEFLKNNNEEYLFKYNYLLGLQCSPLLLNDNIEEFSICDTLDSVISIRANGDIIPCHAYLDHIEDNEYEEIRLDNINNVDINNFGIPINNKFSILINKKEKILSNKIKIKSELGFNCQECKIKKLCHLCFANSKIENNSIIRSAESCMRTMDVADILYKIKKMEGLRELENLKFELHNKEQSILNGIELLINLSKQNNDLLNNINSK